MEMENTVPADQALTQGGSKVEMTPLGKLVMVLIAIGVAFVGWTYYQGQSIGAHGSAIGGHPAARPVTHAMPRPSPASAASPTVDQVSQELSRERHERAVQIAAWRAVSEAGRQQLADLTAVMQTLDARVDAIQRMPTPPRPARDEVAEGARAVHKAADAAKATASVDVASLPIETVTAQAMNLVGFGKGVVGIGNQKLSVGQSLQQGETIVAIDPESRSIVTNRRIINVTN
ncbi:hypothetical protein HQ619_07480 [Burkholderia gladioli]|jgi:hypothetical protein|uniref:hypothetical protein n=1 Tax=Burkholderia gladioli TaxID=28095 RepID=UPI00155F6AEF|nr:hypothetical protein [Burkholderia gladioli]NRF83768.1 hypothetical protein [Burkholderia gladioli]